jgi:hypothetical protein
MTEALMMDQATKSFDTVEYGTMRVAFRLSKDSRGHNTAVTRSE